MKIGLQTLISPTHDGLVIKETLQPFINALTKALKPHEVIAISYQERHTVDIPIIFVQSGGVEGLFKDIYQEIEGPYLFLASNKHNSLAASMELLSFLHQQHEHGEILHGSTAYLAQRILDLASVFATKEKLKGYRMGVIGQPSDWLIASHVNPTQIKQQLGVDVIDIPLSALLYEIQAVSNEEILRPHHSQLLQLPFSNQTITESYRIYTGLKRLAAQHQLQALTLRCFDLLEPLQNTGCLALSLCNEEGLIAGCEGDVPALLSMVILHLLTDQPVFMANPSSIDIATNEVVFAHCTLPWQMASKHTLKPHFESGLGTAIQGHIPEGGATVFKLNHTGKAYFVSNATIQKNLDENTLCRTQIQVILEKSAHTFLTQPIGNHHLICCGQYAELIELFFNW